MKLCVLGSGSRGNSIYVEDNGTAILVDAGFYTTRLETMLHQIGVDPAAISGIVISHDHSDHVIGAARFVKRNKVPLYMNNGTRNALERFIPGDDVVEFSHDEKFEIGGITIDAFPVLHDAADASGFCLEANGRKAAIVTDIGYVTTLVRERLKGCNTILLESNHDEDLLMQGSYPWHLKQRILGKRGHLSNLHAARTLEEVITPELNRVILVHVSRDNNTHELINKAHSSLSNGNEIDIFIAAQESIGEIYNV